MLGGDGATGRVAVATPWSARASRRRRQESGKGAGAWVAPGEQDSAQVLNASSGPIDRGRQDVFAPFAVFA